MPHKGYNGQMAMLRRESERKKSDDLREEIHSAMMVWVVSGLICCVVVAIVTMVAL